MYNGSRAIIVVAQRTEAMGIERKLLASENGRFQNREHIGSNARDNQYQWFVFHSKS